MKPLIIGLTGAAGAGKSTVARALAVLALDRGLGGAIILHPGGPLKAMLRALYTSAGLDEAEAARRIDGDLKRAPCPILGGRSPTWAQQTLGTDWGRDLIAPGLWADLWRYRAEAILATGRGVINDSVRFENEAAAIRALGGVVVGITGRGDRMTGAEAAHKSEAGVAPDFTVPNIATPATAAAALILDRIA